jgi:DNA-binding response OmpR family regulator
VPEATLTAESDRLRALSILLVEDDPQLCELFSVSLVEAGHRVEVARNGREGLEKFLQGWFDVVITDQVMDEMNGDQLAREIRQRAPDRPIILLSGLDYPEADTVPPVDYYAVLSKPITPSNLRRTLTAVAGSQSDVAS